MNHYPTFKFTFSSVTKAKDMKIIEFFQNYPDFLEKYIFTNYGDMYLVNVFSDLIQFNDFVEKYFPNDELLKDLTQKIDLLTKLNNTELKKGLEEIDIINYIREYKDDVNFWKIFESSDFITHATFGMYYTLNADIKTKDEIINVSKMFLNWENNIGECFEEYEGLTSFASEVRYYIGKNSSSKYGGNINVRYLNWSNNWSLLKLEQVLDCSINGIKPYLEKKRKDFDKQPRYQITVCPLCGEDMEEYLYPFIICPDCSENIVE